MNEKNCYKCNSNSTILDGKTWVCANCIALCQCSKNHQIPMDWDFNQSRGDGYTIESMISQSPDVRLNNV